MAAQTNTGQIESNPIQQNHSERIASIEATLPHLATKADLESQTKSLVMWYIATQIALFAALIHFLGGG